MLKGSKTSFFALIMDIFVMPRIGVYVGKRCVCGNNTPSINTAYNLIYSVDLCYIKLYSTLYSAVEIFQHPMADSRNSNMRFVVETISNVTQDCSLQ